MIKRVELKNWKSHLDSKFVFDIGTNVLVGVMGSGKSSVLQAITFALFGNFPELQTKKVRLDELVMDRPSPKDRARVSVTFEVDGKEYTVTREIERGKGTVHSEVRENGKLVEGPSSQRVTEYVERILKVNYELFVRAIHCRQDELDEFLRIPRGKRLKKIDELLMIDKFEKARGNCVTLTNRLIDRKAEKQTIVDQVDEKKLKETMKELEDLLERTEEDENRLRAELEKIRVEKSRVEREVVELEELQKKLEGLTKEKASIESVMKEMERSIHSLEKIVKARRLEDVKDELSTLIKSIEDTEEELKEKRRLQMDLSKKISESKARLEYLEKQRESDLKKLEEKEEIVKKLREIRKRYGDPKAVLDEKRREYEELIHKVEGVEERARQVEEVLEELSTATGKCPVCESVLSSSKKQELMKKRGEELEALRKKLTELTRRREVYKKELKELEEVIEEYNVMEERAKDTEEIRKSVEEASRVVNELSELIKDSERKFEELNGEVERLESRLKESVENKQRLEMLIEKIREYEEKSKELEGYGKRLNEISMQLRGIEKEIGERDLATLRKKLQELVSKESELAARVKSIQEVKREREERLRSVKENLEFLRKQREEIRRLEGIIKNLKILERALERTQTQLREEFVAAVNHTMSELWRNLYPYGDYVDIALNVVENDYVLQLKDRFGKWVNADGVASGGERSVACLALRMAFATVLAPQLRWLILDEPTHNLDTKAVEDLAETLRTRIGDFVEQVFLITHNEKLEEAVSGTLYRLERDKERGGVTKVTLLT